MAADPHSTKSDLGFDRYTLNPVDLAETPDKHAGLRRAATVLLALIIVGAVSFIFWNSFLRDRAPTGPAARQFLASIASENQGTAKFVEKAELLRSNRLRLTFEREVWDDTQGGYRAMTDEELRGAFSAAMQAFVQFAGERQLQIVGLQGGEKIGEAEYLPTSHITNIITPGAEEAAHQASGEAPPKGVPGGGN